MLDKHLIAKTEPVALQENIVIEGNTRITVLADRLFRIEQEPKGHFCDKATQTVWYRKTSKISFSVEQANEELRIATDKAILVWKGFVADSYIYLAGQDKKLYLNNNENLLGTYRTLDGCDGDQCISFENGRCKVEKLTLGYGVISKNGVALLDDSQSLILGADGMLAKREHAQVDCYVFAYGKDYREALKALFFICGKTPLIPRFALGNWWSRYHAYTEKEYLHTIEDFEERGIPLTVATVDMDWHWSTTLDERKQITADGKNDTLHGGNDGWTGYSWNTDLFPDYRRFLRKLHEKNLHVTLNLHPAQGVRYFEDCYQEMAKAVGINPETEQQIPFDMTDETFINAYFKVLHKPYEHDGVDFWWIDWQQGSDSKLEGLDPLWVLNHYHFLDNGVQQEPLILSRYSGIGSHRYPLGFSGDTYVTWESLQYLPYFTATASNAGYCWWSHDIGGHMGGYKDGELYVRFLQFGVFSPINRLHSSDSDTFTKEPWAYKNGAGLIAEEYLRLRHRMIPFLYSASVEVAENGTALIEPMYYEWADEEEAYQCPNQYLFGGQMIVAPVITKSEAEGMAKVDVWLPQGRWTDFFTGDVYVGGRRITMVRWLEEIPVLLKEGGFFILDDRKYTNDVENPDMLKVYITNGNGSYTLHEEQEGKRIDTIFVSEKKEDVQKVRFSCKIGAEGFDTKPRRYQFVFCNILSGEVTVKGDDKAHPAHVDDNECLHVTIEKIVPGVQYEISVLFAEQVDKKRREAIRKIITRFEMDNNQKNEFYEKLCKSDEVTYENIVQQIPVPDVAKNRLLEVCFVDCHLDLDNSSVQKIINKSV